MYDLLVKGGTLVDGTGADRETADVALQDGKIAAVGKLDGAEAKREIDADGLIVAPGFVDVHTHYDGQVTWDTMLTPSVWHGVTTVVMGNCGVGFAPCKPDRRDWLIRLMEGVEDIPGAALAEGIDWQWESFPEFLDAIEAKPHAIDFGTQVPHGALRAYVMGDRGANREAANDGDMEVMAHLTAEAMEAGALGFTTSRTLNHRSADGDPTPTLGAANEEIWAIAEAMGKVDKGVLQFVSDFRDFDDEFHMIRGALNRSGRPASISVVQPDVRPDMYKNILDQISKAQADGLPLRAQVAARPVGLLLGLQATFNPFSGSPAYKEIAHLPLKERVAAMREPGRRDRILNEQPEKLQPLIFQISTAFHKLFPLGEPPVYDPPAEDSVQARADREGRDPRKVAYDMLLDRDGQELLYFPVYNFTEGNLLKLREMILHDHSIFGLGDGGAHCGVICDGSFPTSMVSYWTRDCTAGEPLPLEWVVKGHTQDTARAVGLHDRGIVAPGFKGDLVLFDHDNLQLEAPRMAFDLPADARRLVQKAEGYRALISSGEVVMEDGEPTGALPGKLVRGGQATPV